MIWLRRAMTSARARPHDDLNALIGWLMFSVNMTAEIFIRHRHTAGSFQIPKNRLYGLTLM